MFVPARYDHRFLSVDTVGERQALLTGWQKEDDVVGELLARVVAIGLVAALVPVPIVIVLIILAGPSGVVRAWWFVLGFAGSLFIAGAAGLLVASQPGISFNPRTMSAIALVIGVAFLMMATPLALRQRRGHGVSGAKSMGVVVPPLLLTAAPGQRSARVLSI